MGGRGTSSVTASSGSSSLKQQFREVARANASGRSAASRDYAAVAEAAAGLVGTKKLKGLLASQDVDALARELGGSGGGGNLSKLNSLSEGANQPLSMSDAFDYQSECHCSKTTSYESVAKFCLTTSQNVTAPKR